MAERRPDVSAPFMRVEGSEIVSLDPVSFAMIVPPRQVFLMLLAGALGIGCGKRSGESPIAGPPPPPSLFRDVTEGSGLTAVFVNGEESNRYSILEVMGGGVAAIDFDGDGLLDLFFPGGGDFAGPAGRAIRGNPPKLFRNLGDFQFQDATASSGLSTLADGQPWFYNQGAAAGDYDRDGWTDLLLTGYGRLALWHNEPGPNGGRVFRDVTQEAGLFGPHFWSTSAAWGDLDGDGFPELYVCHYLDWSLLNDPLCTGYRTNIPRDVCPPRQFQSKPHLLFRNRGDGTFENATPTAGLRQGGNCGKGLGVLIADLDGDGKNDIYVCNDGEDNFLYLNRGGYGELRFEEKGLESGSARDINGMPNGSMGVDLGDPEGSGRPAVWVTNYENEFHAMYQLRAGRGLFFEHASSRMGLTAIGSKFVGFGTAFVDADLDGWEDLVIANGHVIRHSPTDNIRQRPVLFRNVPSSTGRQFLDAPEEAGPYFSQPRVGRGLAVADLNNDGRPDLIISHINEPARILKNEAPSAQRWLGVRLVGNALRDVTGAKLTVETNAGKRVRWLAGGRSYLSSSDTRRVIGLGAGDLPERLIVEWPSGFPRRESWEGLASNQYHLIRQGAGFSREK